MEKEGFLTDFKRIQVISGFAAASGALMTVALLFLVPTTPEAKQAITFVALGTLVFIAVYYLIPALYLNKKLAFLPDLVYILAITIVMRYLGQYNYVYFILYMILAAIDAFIFPLYQYAIVIIGMIIGIIFANFDSANGLSPMVVYQTYGILTLAIVTHLIARDALRVKEKEESLTGEIVELESDKREIRTLLQSISDGMFVVNAQNKITFFNKAALSILSMVAPEEKILGRDINDFLPTVGPKGPEPITREVFATYKPEIRDSLRVVFPDRVAKLHTNVTPVMNEDGKLQGAIIFFRDITKEKRVEEQRAEFNAIASHELRTPLTIIEGYLFFLLDPSSKAKYDKLTKEYLEKAHEAAQNVIHLVTDILTVVKTEEKELQVALSKVDPKKYLKEIVRDFEKEAKTKKINLNFKVATTRIIPEIVTDPIKMKEISSNLIGNALKFTEKGSVTVELGLLKDEIIVNVIDSGPGIEKNEQKMVFQKFFRSENWQTRKTGGTGLGLYIVKTLAERLGGRVGLQSEPGKGSRFYYTLPIEYKNKEDLKKVSEKELKSFITNF